MPKCPGCGNEIPGAARFCSICGRPAGATAPVPPPSAQPTRAPYAPTTGGQYDAVDPGAGNKKAALIGGGIVALAIVAFLLAKASGILGAHKTAAPMAALLNAPPVQTVGAPILNAPPVQAPNTPVLQPPMQIGNPMPEDIIAYLRWLKQFEAARHDLEAREMAELQVVAINVAKESATGAQSLGTLDNDPTEAAPKTTNTSGGLDFAPLDTTVQQWNQVAGIFQAKTPPNPCAPLATAYNGALTESVRQMAGIISSFRGALASLKSSNGGASPDVMGTLASLEGEKSTRAGSEGVDERFSDSDTALNTVRNRYTNIPSDIDASHFSIKEGGGGGGLGLGL